VILLSVIALGAIGWHYSSEILGPDSRPGRTGQSVLSVSDSTITLVSTPKSRRPGYWAIEWPGGFGTIGPLISVDGGTVTTRFRIMSGSPPDTTSRLAGFAPDADPRTWLGLDFEDVTIPARVGPLPAWQVHGRDSTWALFVHGRAATRAEVLRMLPAYVSLGMPCLIIAYRNDAGAPRVGDGCYRLGLTEWIDLEDAVRYARGHGARGVVTVGCSMGGGIVAQFLRRSSERAITRAAVLDAPALDWNAVLALAGSQLGVPGPITEFGKLVASLRSGLRWRELTQVSHAGEFSTPMLVLHGDADDTVPVEVSRRFAAARPDLVTLHVIEGAGHVESANVNPDRYAAIVSGWLRERGIGIADSVPAP
jgi:alpha-beta hydrolase superfamily lysophospholipase